MYLCICKHVCMEKEMAMHFSILAWKIPWTKEPDGVTRVGHDLVTKPLPLFMCTRKRFAHYPTVMTSNHTL